MCIIPNITTFVLYLCSENKGANQLRGSCAADLSLCFGRNAKSRFSHDAAYLGKNNSQLGGEFVTLNSLRSLTRQVTDNCGLFSSHSQFT